MLERGGFSFVALLVINPIAILFYQNCSFMPVAHSEVTSREVPTQRRAISSVDKPVKLEANLKEAGLKLAHCDSSRENCPTAGVE